MPKDAVTLDIGANIGIMTVYLAKKAPKGQVYAYEPIPANFKILEKITQLFKLKNAQLFKHALGDEDKEIEMVLPIEDSVKLQGLGHVIHDTIEDFNEGEHFKTISCQLDSLDYLMSKNISGIKIDVENFEYFVFKGGENLIKKNKPIIYCELWENENRTRCFNLLSSLGYEIKILHKHSLIPFDTDTHKALNFFFIPR